MLTKKTAATPKKPAKKELFSLVEREFSKGQQSATMKSHYKITSGPHKGKKICTVVKSDAYKFQSSAIVSIWKDDDLTWSRVANIPYSNMKTKEALHVYPKLLESFFSEDTTELLRRAQMILE